MPVLESDDRQAEHKRLIRDDHVKDMADQIKMALSEGLFTLESIAHEGSEPRSSFMIKCNKEFKRRGGEPPLTIGGVATAVMQLVTQ